MDHSSPLLRNFVFSHQAIAGSIKFLAIIFMCTNGCTFLQQRQRWFFTIQTGLLPHTNSDHFYRGSPLYPQFVPHTAVDGDQG